MTDRIDLDDLDATDESTDEDTPNRGDWLWGDGETDADDDPDAPEYDPADVATETAATPGTPDASDGSDEASSEGDADTANPATPRVPRTDDDRPVGIPKASGGSGGTPAHEQPAETKEMPEEDEDAAGPHGGGTDDMAQVFTFEAIQRLANIHTALADVEQWADWVGVVGEVDAHVINKFQREERVDLDFFNGTGTGPAERLAEIDEHSMFYSERMVVVGCEGEEWMAEGEEWEFVPLETAAAKAGWQLSE